MPMRFMMRCLCHVLTLLAATLSAVAFPTDLRGNLGVHDPSTVVKCEGRYYIYCTGQGILAKSSADKIYWKTEPPVFAHSPVWTTNAVPGFAGLFWAPDVLYFNGLYHLYYAVSTFGSQISGIGLATSPTLNPTDPTYQWTDHGAVIQSGNSVNYNAIDPSITFDNASNLWMSFGSYSSGIKLIQLDASTGLRNSTNTTIYALADNSSIEASYLYHYGGYYYLFVNWGACCEGVDSTYNIRVGRSTAVTGPFMDRNGVNMMDSGGTLFLKTTGKYIGPGQIGILNDNGTTYFTCHYYDANVNGAPTLDMEPLSWTSDGWPEYTNNWSAAYHFQMDARDDNGEYYGLLPNGAGFTVDPLLGDVANFNGTNQYVNLPDGAANACTIIANFKWNGGAAWQRVFDFGRGTNSYAFLTPSAYNGTANGVLRFAITSTGAGGEEQLNATTAAPLGAWTQVAVVTDGSNGVLYVNGVAVVTNQSMTLTLPDIAPTNTWFGRSQFSADPYFNGQISSVRIFGRALLAAEIVAPQPSITAPLANSFYQPGGPIAFSGQATDFAGNPLSVSNLTWSIEFCGAGVTNVVFGPLVGTAAGSFAVPATSTVTNGFYQIVLTAIDGVGRAATNWVTVFPVLTNANWNAQYDFQNGASDANGHFDGTLVHGASTTSVPVRGSVLNLSGSSQYVSLPSGAGAFQTISGWIKWNGGNDWQRIFDFGSGNTNYVMFTAEAADGLPEFQITPNGGAEVRILDAPNPLPVNVWTHVAVMLDGRQAVMFINGQAVAVDASVNLLPGDVSGSSNFLGHSQFSADPYFNGQMDEIQLSATALPVSQITSSTLTVSNGAPGLTLTWPAWTNGLVPATTTNLTGAAWATLRSTSSVTNGIRMLTMPITGSSAFFRLQYP